MSAAGSEGAREPLISVALCTYNGERFLRRQLDSLLNQTHRHLEIVAVDDGSKDGTPALLEEYARRDARVRVIVNPANLGFRRNFEYAMSLCVGDYIAPCDQDDLWLPDKLRVLLAALGPGAMVYCDSELIDAGGRSLGARMSDRWRMQSTRDPAGFVWTNCVSGHAMLFRRTLLTGAPPTPEVFFHDWWLAALAASRGGLVYYPQVLVHYRQHETTVTDVLKTRAQDAVRPPGRGMKFFEVTRQRIAALEALHDEHHAFFATWLRLWERHAQAWFSVGLVFFMLRNRPRIFALTRRSVAGGASKILQYIFGLGLRRLARPAKYRIA